MYQTQGISKCYIHFKYSSIESCLDIFSSLLTHFQNHLLSKVVGINSGGFQKAFLIILPSIKGFRGIYF